TFPNAQVFQWFTGREACAILEFCLPQQGVGRVFAIIESGGRQVKVMPGSIVEVDRLDAQPGDEVTIDRVLFLEKDGGEIFAGAPFVANVKVLGVVDGESRGPNIRVFKKKRRKGMRRTKGHRSTLTRVRIKEFQL